MKHLSMNKPRKECNKYWMVATAAATTNEGISHTAMGLSSVPTVDIALLPNYISNGIRITGVPK